MGTGSGLNFSTTPSMGLMQPVPSVCGAFGVEPPGKSWLELINASMGTVDAHNHAPGFGVPVPSAGLNINADVPWGANNITLLRSARFSPIGLGTLTVQDIGCLVVSGSDLYYVDTSGTQVRLTSGGGVAGTPGSIGGLVSPASATYTPASKLFSFTSSSGFVAGISCGPLILGDASASGGKAATIKVPAALAANYNLTLPPALPGAPSFLTMDATGVLGVGTPVTGALTSANLSSSAAILGSQLAASAGILRSQLSAVGQQVSTSCGTFTTTSAALVDVTNLTVTITTTGRPVWLVVQADGTTNSAGMSISAPGVLFTLAFLRAGGRIATYNMGSASSGVSATFPSASYLDTPAAGTYVYKIQVASDGTRTTNINNLVLLAYEL